MGVNSLQWYYLPDLRKDESIVTIDGDEWHHCYNVVRMREGDGLAICDGKGLCFEGKILHATNKKGQIELLQDLAVLYPASRNFRIHIAIAPTKNIDRIEFAIEKLVEIGIDELTFLNCDHNERTHLRIDRMQKIVVAASKQSRKIRFPVLHDMTSPLNCAQVALHNNPNEKILVCHLDEKSKPVSENYFASENVLIMIGPEGGFSQNEVDALQSFNSNFIHLGPYRLRVETAAIVACANIHLLNQLNTRT